MYDSMDVQEILRGVEPLSGQVIPVRTVQEARPREEFGGSTPLPGWKLVVQLTIPSGCLCSRNQRERCFESDKVSFFDTITT